ncbi:hypothetical protein J3Q64DRAFT_1701398 [Phycomyces blakesleeanus]|uniref:Uncharacterized protein n=2 Tax=Phycomyces blakesleeanus TaxID=4837 RepID=A0A167L0R2_PHYB8|nr:hypothetical protein PHYBLDRAFT_172571 [Phycomyces blakesleeanus NRRL 1555(-)]OAD69319.1 hypothetical protein PHYBLDRAFT_172571 [Phycomyces blakesleeanus NRRL 1555(-)]|eukprot:XP_018287359.1 hypothetical protein PHYBLDRAFT_172571 [Phycomyces blakesleeanus NRRL 1555(-)]
MLEYEYAKSEINRFLLVRFYIKLNAAYISSNFHLIYLVNIVGSVSKTGKFERGLLVSCVVVTQIGYIFVAMEEGVYFQGLKTVKCSSDTNKMNRSSHDAVHFTNYNIIFNVIGSG